MIKIVVSEFTDMDYVRDAKKYCPMVYVSPNTKWYNFVVKIYLNDILCDSFDLSHADSKPKINEVVNWFNSNNANIGSSIVNLLREAEKQNILHIVLDY